MQKIKGSNAIAKTINPRELASPKLIYPWLTKDGFQFTITHSNWNNLATTKLPKNPLLNHHPRFSKIELGRTKLPLNPRTNQFTWKPESIWVRLFNKHLVESPKFSLSQIELSIGIPSNIQFKSNPIRFNTLVSKDHEQSLMGPLTTIHA